MIDYSVIQVTHLGYSSAGIFLSVEEKLCKARNKIKINIRTEKINKQMEINIRSK